MAGYVEGFKPLLRRPKRLSSLVPWRGLADETLGIMRTKGDGWLCCLRIECPDLGGLSLDAQDIVTLRLNEVWKLLPPGSGVWHHVKRREALQLPSNENVPVVSALLDEEHVRALNAPGASWTTDVSITLACRPPKTSEASGLAKYLWRRPETASQSYGMDQFIGDTDQVLGLLASVCPTVKRLAGPDLTAYLHGCVSVYDHLLVTDEGLDLYGVTADSGFWPGTVPIIGDYLRKQYIRSLTLARKFPDGTTTAIFRELNRLPMAFDVVTRWIPKAKPEAKKIADRTQVNWLSQKKKKNVKNSFVTKQGDDADTLRNHILSGDYELGLLTQTFMVRGETETLEPTAEELADGNRRLSVLARVVRHTGCSVYDDPINQTEAFVGSWPGSAYANIDALEMTSLNFSTLALSDTPWQGITVNTHLKSTPLFYARTEGCMRVGVDTFVGDRGNFLMVGPLGSGKSTALGFFDSCWLRDPVRQLYPFDVGRSNRCVVLCHGGQYHDLSSMGLQVMADLDNDAARPWIFDWLKRRVYHAGVPRHPDVETFLWGGLEGPNSLRGPEHRDKPRTLTAYLYLTQASANKLCSHGAIAQGGDRARHLASLIPLILAALWPFAQGGAYGHLTDAPVDTLKIGRIHGFELEGLLKKPDAYSAVLEIVWFRLRDQRDGTPTRYIFDEGWHVLNHDIWVGEQGILTVDMPGWRRQNASGGWATQSLSQFKGSKLTPLVLEMTQSRFWLPNSQALDEGVREGYLGVQLGREEIERNIVLAEPRGEMYWTMANDHLGHPRRRKLDLRLGPLARCVCGSNAETDHETMDTILSQFPAEEFAVHWFAQHGWHEESARVAQSLV